MLPLSLALKSPVVYRVARIVNPSYVRTPLLQESLDRPGFDHFVIEPETVADAVVEQLHSGNGGHLILPARYSIASAIRGFPSWVQELVRNSINQGMFAVSWSFCENDYSTVFYWLVILTERTRPCFLWNSREGQGCRNGLEYLNHGYALPQAGETRVSRVCMHTISICGKELEHE